jgi:hypothetical protein
MRWPRIIFLSLILLLLGRSCTTRCRSAMLCGSLATQLQLTEISGWSALFYAQSDSGVEGTSVQRDVRIISAVRPDNTPIDYRNEDTGLFGWPPYFKIDSQDVQTEAQDLRSTRDNPLGGGHPLRLAQNLFSSYPNAVSIRACRWARRECLSRGSTS